MSASANPPARGGLHKAAPKKARPVPMAQREATNSTTSNQSGQTAPPEGATSEGTASKFDLWTGWFFALALLVGIGCRFYGLNWDESVLLHPDERFCLDTASKLAPAQSWSEFFTSNRSPLNPVNYSNVHYVYGQLPLFLLRLAQTIWPNVQAVLVGRALAGVFDTLTVVFTLLTARRLFGPRHALCAAALVALSALHIQQSHFFVTDTFAAAFMTASFWAGTRFIDTKRVLDATLMGLFWGLALACKISAALFGIAVLAFLAYGLWSLIRSRNAKVGLFAFVACLAAMLLAFRLGHPMGFRGETLGGIFDLHLEPRFWEEVKVQGGITRGEIDVPFNVQWVGTKPWLFSFKNLGGWGYGWALWLSGLAGLVLFMASLLRKPTRNSLKTREKSLVLPVLFAAALLFVVLFGLQGAAFSKFSRYYLPLTPLVAFFSTFLWRELTHRNARMKWGMPAAVGFTLLWCVAVTSIYSERQPRLTASLWAVENIPPDTPVANETDWDETIPIGWAPAVSKGVTFRSQKLQTFDLDTPQKRQNIEAILDASEWIFCSSGRSWQNIPRWPQKWPMTTEFYRALWDGSLGFHIEREFTNYPHLGPWQFPDGDAEEALHVYDHPRVILWKKNPDYSSQKVREILNRVPLPISHSWTPRDAK